MAGSLQNMILGNSASKMAAVGNGGTILMHTDRHAVTIVEVIGETKVRVQRDTAIRGDCNGMSDSQSWIHRVNPNGSIQTFTLRKNGRWIQEGESLHNGTQLTIGHRSTYHDFGF